MVLACFGTMVSWAQAPPNDDCANATVLTVNADLLCGVETPGTLDMSTASADAEGCTGTYDDDVWYQFVATATSHEVQVNNIAGSNTDLVYQLSTGTCGSLTELGCFDTPDEGFTASGLSVDSTYYVRVATWTSTGGQNTTFDMCIGTPPPPPTNNVCATATALTVNPDTFCVATTSGTLEWATASGEAESCTGTYDDDVWYEFTATASVHEVRILNIAGSNTDLVYQLSEGTCGSLTQLGCFDTPDSSFIASGLSVDSTYYVRLATWTSTGGQNTTYDMCVLTPPPPPANDDCSGAVTLTVNPDTFCVASTPGTLAWASPSSDGETCTGTFNDDVWYKFTATGPAHIVRALNIADGDDDLVFQLSEGVCDTLDQLQCHNNPDSGFVARDLVPGNEYYVRVATNSSTSGARTTFDMCIQTPPPPPVNDTCGGAITVTPGINTCGPEETGSNVWATDSGLDGYGCTTYSGGDLWYEFTVPPGTQTFSFESSASDFSTTLLSVRSSCMPLTEIFCETIAGTGMVEITGVTPGSTYFLRLADLSNNDLGEITFCLRAATCVEPTGLDGTDITADGVTAFWDDGGVTGYVVEYGLDGFDPDTGAMVATTDTFLMITGLESATDYDVYVKAICGSDSSTQDGPYSFTTLCQVYIPDYLEDFTSFIPTCWEEASEGTPATGPMSFGTGDWTADGFGNVGTSGSARVELWNLGTSDWIVSPEFDLTGGPFQTDFDIALTIWNNTNPGTLGSDDTVQFLITTDMGTTWAPLLTWDASSVISNTGENVIVDLTPYTGMTVQFGFWGSEGTVDDLEDNNFYVDNFFVRTPPTCPKPTELGIADLMGETARAFWTDNSTATDWRVEFDTAGFPYGTGNVLFVTDTFADLTGLAELSDYEFYVQAICGAMDSSLVVGPFSFTTIHANPPALCAEMFEPANTAIGVSVTPNFSFTQPDDADGVLWLLGETSGMLDTITDYTAGDTAAFFLNFQNPATTYFWQIIPYNSAGATPGCPEFRYTTQDPPQDVSGATCGAGFLGEFFFEDFSGTAPAGWTGNIGTGSEVWDVTQTGGTTSGQTGPTGAHSGTHYAYFEASVNGSINDTAVLISPKIDLSGTSDAIELEFYVHKFGNQMGPLTVEASSDSIVWDIIQTLPLAFQGFNDRPWLPARYDLSVYSGGDLWIRFTGSKDDPAFFNSDMAIDAIKIKTCQACPNPSNGVASNITHEGADLSWTEPSTTTTWTILVDTTGAGLGPTNLSYVATSMPFTWSDGLPVSTYDWWVASSCDEVTSSDTIGPFTFTTGCEPQLADYCQGFETGFPGEAGSLGGDIYDCWGNIASSNPQWTIDINSTGSSGTGPTGPYSGSKYIFLETSSSTAGDSDTLMGPIVDVSALTVPRLAFAYHMFGGDMGTLSWELSDDDGATWTVLGSLTGEQQTATDDPWILLRTDISAYGDMVMIRFVGSAGSSFEGDMSLDEICVEETPSCEKPIGLSSDNVTFSGFDVYWSAGGPENMWEVSYGLAGFTPGSGTQVTTSVDSAALTGLLGNTMYDVYVRAICGVGDLSLWLGPVSVLTLPVPPLNDLCVDATDIMCSDSLGGQTTLGASGGISGSCLGTQGDNVWYKITGTGEQVTIKVDADISGGFEAQIDVYESGDGTCDDISCIGGAGSGGNPVEIDFIGVSGTTYYIAVGNWINGDPSGDFGIKVDCSPCFDIEDGEVINIAANTADVTWASALGATGFVVEYGLDGFVQGTGSTVTSGTAGGPISIGPLLGSTDYDVYISEFCGGSGDTLGPISFTTECDIIIPYYKDSFNTFVPDCWEEASTGDPAVDGPMSLGFGSWVQDDFGNLIGPNGKAARINLDFNSDDDWLITPVFDLQGDVWQANFDVAQTTFAGSSPESLGSDDVVQFLITDDGGATWEVLREWNSGTSVAVGGEAISINLELYSGVVQFAFWGSEGTINDPEDVDFFVDNFEIAEVPDEPCNFLFISGPQLTDAHQGTQIVSNASIAAPNLVIFRASTGIDLNANFDVGLGAEFEAIIEPCP